MTESKKPNFIVFLTDQQRWDHVGCYGNEILKTPNIDALARGGVRFERFYVSSPLCQPNRATLMTGRTPMVHGVRTNGIALDRNSVTFVDLLRAAGWRTALIGKSHLQNVTGLPPGPRAPAHPERAAPPAELQEATRGHRRGPEYDAEVNPMWRKDPLRAVPKLPYYGFDTVRLAASHSDRVQGDYTCWFNSRHPNPDSLRGRPNAIPDETITVAQSWRTSIPEELYPTTYVADQTISYLKYHQDSAEGRPFFVTCSFPDPHHPFTPPGKYWDMYNPDDIPVPTSHHKPMTSADMPAGLWFAYEKGRDEPDAQWPVPVSARHAQEAIALNYGMISMVDDAVGRVLAAMTPEVRANTIVIFTSDHGDYMGDHGVILKLGLHFQGVVRVPFVWQDPDGASGKVREDLGGTIDIGATILARAGLQSYFGMQGRDLFDVDADPRDGILIDDHGMAVFKDPEAKAGLMSYITDEWRLSVWEGSDWGELYSLADDPDEMTNLWSDADHAAIRQSLLHRLLREMISLRDRALTPTSLA